MNAEFIAMLDYLERERGIKRDILLEAVSNALLSASKKSVGASRDLRIDINPKSGEIRALANLLVVEDVTNPQDEIELSKARKIKSDANIGDTVEVEVTPKNFGRIAAQTAKQAMMQRIRQAEKEMIYEEFKDRAGEIVVEAEVQQLAAVGVVGFALWKVATVLLFPVVGALLGLLLKGALIAAVVFFVMWLFRKRRDDERPEEKPAES